VRVVFAGRRWRADNDGLRARCACPNEGLEFLFLPRVEGLGFLLKARPDSGAGKEGITLPIEVAEAGEG